jgi:hypothetical protein
LQKLLLSGLGLKADLLHRSRARLQFEMKSETAEAWSPRSEPKRLEDRLGLPLYKVHPDHPAENSKKPDVTLLVVDMCRL